MDQILIVIKNERILQMQRSVSGESEQLCMRIIFKHIYIPSLVTRLRKVCACQTLDFSPSHFFSLSYTPFLSLPPSLTHRSPTIPPSNSLFLSRFTLSSPLFNHISSPFPYHSTSFSPWFLLHPFFPSSILFFQFFHFFFFFFAISQPDKVRRKKRRTRDEEEKRRTSRLDAMRLKRLGNALFRLHSHVTRVFPWVCLLCEILAKWQ